MRQAGRALIGWAPVVAAVVVMLGLFIWGMVGNQNDQREAMAQEITLNKALYSRTQERARLETLLSQVGSKGYVEREARASLGYLKNGEIRFRVVNPENLSKYTAEEHQIYIDERQLDEETK